MSKSHIGAFRVNSAVYEHWIDTETDATSIIDEEGIVLFEVDNNAYAFDLRQTGTRIPMGKFVMMPALSANCSWKFEPNEAYNTIDLTATDTYLIKLEEVIFKLYLQQQEETK